MSLQDTFPEAVKTELGNGAYRPGLQALKAEDRKRVSLRDPRQCHGSADIDKAMARTQPNAARWDYVVAHDATLHFIEVHPAHTSSVAEMRSKKSWLQQWLGTAALGELKPHRFHWIASGKYAITPGSRQSRALAQLGLKPEKRLML